MYKKSFYIEKNTWNNSFSFNKRENKKIKVSSLLKAEISWVKIWKEIVFEDFNYNWKLTSSVWLKNFYEINWKNRDLYLFDNHNHALFFWYKSFFENKIKKPSSLIHIDEHTDLRKPENMDISKYFNNLENIFYYTNYIVNVWNYIKPALKEWLIDEVIQIRSKENIDNFDFKKIKNQDIILNLDLDFFEKSLDYIDYDIKKQLILKIASKASIITVATSPFFIDQKLAINIFKDIFW